MFARGLLSALRFQGQPRFLHCVPVSFAAGRGVGRRRRPELEKQEETADDDSVTVFSSAQVSSVAEGKTPEWTWVGDFPRHDFSEATDNVKKDADFSASVDTAAFQNYTIPEKYRYLGACALNFTHREYIGTGSKRGQPVPGVKKVTLRLKVSELGLTAGGRKYLAALVGARYNERLDELKLTEDLYPAVEDNVRKLYDVASRLVDEAGKADAIDAAVAAGRDPDTDLAVKALHEAAQGKATARAAEWEAEQRAKADLEKKKAEDAKAAKASAIQERIARKSEAEKRAEEEAAAKAVSPAAQPEEEKTPSKKPSGKEPKPVKKGK